jgi:hypothetical protein
LHQGKEHFVAVRGRWEWSRTGTLVLWQSALFLLHSPFPSPASVTDASQQPSRPAPATTAASSSASAAITDSQSLNDREQVLVVEVAQQCDQLHPGRRPCLSSSPEQQAATTIRH